MINYFMIYFVLGFSYIFLLTLFLILIKRYITNNADIRVINYAQFMIIITFMAIEAFHYLYTGNANQICILLVRNFLIFALFTHLNCKLIGYKNIYTSKRLRNNLFIFHNSLFYITIMFICFSYLKVDVYKTDQYSLERIFQIINFMGTENYYPKFTSSVPIIYCAISTIFIIYMDFKERRDKLTKFMGIAEITPLIIMTLNIFSIYTNINMMIKSIINSFYFIIPITAMANEGLNTLSCSNKIKNKKDDNIDDDEIEIKKLIDKAFKENKNKITKAGEVQAKVIAKEIEKNEEILWCFPTGKRFEKYKMFIINILNETN